MNTRDYLSKAILRLLRKSPFYSTIIVKQNIVSDDTYDAPMATDGKTLIYNPDMIKEIPLKELTQVLMHEAMHVANKHHIRMKAVRPKYERKFQDKNINFQKIFNIAADLAINSLLCRVEYDIWKASEMLKNGCVPGEDFSHQQFAKYPKLESSEYYLQRLSKDIDSMDEDVLSKLIDDFGLDNNSGCSLIECEGSPQEAEAEANKNIASATIMARGAGEKSKTAQAIIAANEREHSLNWKVELNRFIQTNTKGKPNYRRPNRRYENADFIFPSRKSKTVENIVMLVDVSGSMSNEAVATVYNHMTDIVRFSENTNITMVPFDDEVFTKHETVFNKSNLPVREKDRMRCSYGGTRYSEAMRYAIEKKPAGIVMLTDLMPYDEVEFNDIKCNTPFLMLSVYKASGYCWGDNVTELHNRFPNKRILEVDI